MSGSYSNHSDIKRNAQNLVEEYFEASSKVPSFIRPSMVQDHEYVNVGFWQEISGLPDLAQKTLLPSLPLQTLDHFHMNLGLSPALLLIPEWKNNIWQASELGKSLFRARRQMSLTLQLTLTVAKCAILAERATRTKLKEAYAALHFLVYKTNYIWSDHVLRSRNVALCIKVEEEELILLAANLFPSPSAFKKTIKSSHLELQEEVLRWSYSPWDQPQVIL